MTGKNIGDQSTNDRLNDIAIIGLVCRFPGARDVDEFWANLRDGVESISSFSDEELLAGGISQSTIADPNYVKAGGVLDEIDLFDAEFFGFNRREAETLDPHHRLLMEGGWEALESAGYNPQQFGGRIGVYVGAGASDYPYHLYLNSGFRASVSGHQIALGTGRDFLATRLSYKLNLRGPSLNVQTACSTSLVAVHLACQSLLNGECEMALAGAAALAIPPKRGYLHQEGGIMSRDGHCRAFDASAAGTVAGSGMGIVVLKRATDALADGDHIRAYIKATAINNDGAVKIGYTAPGIEGQAEVIADALAVAGVDTETITYVEAHGTGTELGDPIEIAALTRVFRADSTKSGFCGVGSVKGNIGHLDVAAGIAGLIKTVLALEHQTLPPSLHFQKPNPKLELDGSPFYIVNATHSWESGVSPRRAGVSSFGVGGTNAHVILEESCEITPLRPTRPRLLVLSAGSANALDASAANLAGHLRRRPTLNLTDVAYTLAVGRKSFKYRRAFVCWTIDEAVERLQARDPDQVDSSDLTASESLIVFMFPGQGTQRLGMARLLSASTPSFRDDVDLCLSMLDTGTAVDLRRLLFAETDDQAEAQRDLTQTRLAQPALFIVEYSLAQLLMRCGIVPHAMIGHSLGEYVAACLAGVFSLKDGLGLVAARGQLMQQAPEGGMLAVPMAERDIEPLLDDGLSLSAVNGPSRCVISGTSNAIAGLERRLEQGGTMCRRLKTSHAFHSQSMESVVEPFVARVKQITLNRPKIPYISNFTGARITEAQATDPLYWGLQLRNTVRFGEGLAELLNGDESIFVEVGVGETLTTIANQHPDRRKEQAIIPLLPSPTAGGGTIPLLRSMAKLWVAGAEINWQRFYSEDEAYRIPLPTYPFQRQRYWVDSATAPLAPALEGQQREAPASVALSDLPAGAGAHEVMPKDLGMPEADERLPIADAQELAPTDVELESVIREQIAVMSHQLQALADG